MEELKLIAETISKLGEGAQTAFIVWILSRYVLLYLLTASAIIVPAICLYRYVKRISSLQQIMEAAGILGDELSPDGLEEIIEKVRKK